MMDARVSVLLALATVAGPAAAAAPEGALPLSSGWELRGDAALETVDGREALRVGSGWAVRKDVRLQDGTIEFEVQTTRERSFVYVAFRMQDEREYEEFYLRPHKSGLPDAVQYAPVYQGASAWQLHHGPGATAALTFEPGAWTRVRAVLQGRRAALFVGDMARPALVVPRTGHDPRAGFFALRAFRPTPDGGPVARFANVVVRPGAAPVDLRAFAVEAAEAPAGAVRVWAVSQAIPAPADVPERPADAQLGPLARAEADPRGVLEMHRFVRLPEGRREVTAAARVVVRADAAGVRAFDLGFSDQVVVFLNGAPVFRGEGSYSFDRPRREGLIGYDQARLFLPLRAGDNEILAVVSDGFGGMGLSARFVDPSGLTVEAR